MLLLVAVGYVCVAKDLLLLLCGGRKLLGDPDDGDDEAVVLVVLGVMMMVRERVKRQAAMPGKNLNEADQ